MSDTTAWTSPSWRIAEHFDNILTLEHLHALQRHHGVADVVEGVCCAMLQLGIVLAVVPDTARALLEAVKQLGPVEDAQLLNRIVKAVTLVACSTEQARSVLMNGGLCENVMAFVRWRRVQGGHPSSDQPFRSLLLLCEYISRSREACQRLMTLPQNLPQFLSQCLGTWAEDETVQEVIWQILSHLALQLAAWDFVGLVVHVLGAHHRDKPLGPVSAEASFHPPGGCGLLKAVVIRRGRVLLCLPSCSPAGRAGPQDIP